MANNINFEVISIAKANKNGCAVVNVKFNGSDKVYNYVRMIRQSAVVIDGCKISFDKDYKLVNVERIYDTENKRKVFSKKGKGTKAISEMLKEEIKEQEIKIPEIKPEIPDGEIRHKKFNQLKCCVMAGIPAFMSGPAGSGKSHAAEMVAKELGWNFYFSNSIQQEFKLTGFIDAGGKYHGTQFYDACVNDGDCIFFLDEIDASIPEVLVLLNTAIEQGYFEFPTGRVDMKHVHFIAAGNTVGSGADDMYTGRMVLDQATLDRFHFIEWSYDERIEMLITKGNINLVSFIHDIRKQAEEKGIRATFSYRCLNMVTKLEAIGMDLEDIISGSVMKGLDKDTVNTFNTSGETKYHKVLKDIQNAA